jgi:hypothetical protein
VSTLSTGVGGAGEEGCTTICGRVCVGVLGAATTGVGAEAAAEAVGEAAGCKAGERLAHGTRT